MKRLLLLFLLLLLSFGACFPLKAADESALYQRLIATRDPAQALALAQAGEAAVPLLVQGLERKDRVAALCAWALARHPQAAAAPALRARLLTADQVAGYFAARALGRMPGPENVAALATLVPSETNGFWELSSDGKGRLRDAWDSQGRRSSTAAPPGMAYLRVAYAAMEALGELGGPIAEATLRRALTNDQYLIRYGAARGLGRMGHGREEGTFGKLKALSTEDPVLIVRQAARQALAVMRDEKRAVRVDILTTSPIWKGDEVELESASRLQEKTNLPPLPESIAFIKTKNRSDATFGFRDSYFFPKTPRYHSGENLYTLTPPRPSGALKNLTQLTQGEVQGPEVSFDGTKILFAMRRDKTRDGFHVFEIGKDGSGLRQVSDGNCNGRHIGTLWLKLDSSISLSSFWRKMSINAMPVNQAGTIQHLRFGKQRHEQDAAYFPGGRAPNCAILKSAC